MYIYHLDNVRILYKVQADISIVISFLTFGTYLDHPVIFDIVCDTVTTWTNTVWTLVLETVATHWTIPVGVASDE